jgi:hypothetical protein
MHFDSLHPFINEFLNQIIFLDFLNAHIITIEQSNKLLTNKTNQLLADANDKSNKHILLMLDCHGKHSSPYNYQLVLLIAPIHQQLLLFLSSTM